MAITTQHLEELIEERRDADEAVVQQAHEAASLVRNARHLLVLTGAGLSTSAGISCYRGPEGVWTSKALGRPVNLGTPIPEAVPTLSHFGLVALQEAGLLKHVGSQNIDNLHVRSGLRLENLTEVHGNIFKERCIDCGNEYIRSKEPVYKSAIDGGGESHFATGSCPECGGTLKDSVINFGEQIHAEYLDMLFAQAAAADLCLVLGTSLAVQPFNELPRDVKAHGGKVIIVNMQKTPLDSLCDGDGVRVFAETDHFMDAMMSSLGLVPRFLEAQTGEPVQQHLRRRCEVEQQLAELCKVQQSQNSRQGAGFCVTPLPFCTHAQIHCGETLGDVDVTGSCAECGHRGENWLCAECQTLHCGRYVNGHMARHAKETGHCIGLSLSDSSVWCFACDGYVDEDAVVAVQPLFMQLYRRRHGEWDPRPLLRMSPVTGGA